MFAAKWIFRMVMLGTPCSIKLKSHADLARLMPNVNHQGKGSIMIRKIVSMLSRNNQAGISYD